MTIGQRIKKLRETLDLTQEAVAKQVGCATQTIFKYENEIVTNIPLDKIEKIATALQTTPAYLMGWEGQDNALDGGKKTKGVWIPVLGKVQAGVPMEAIEDIIDYEEIDADMAKNGDYFALQIKGASMEPRFVEGDVVIVRKQPIVENGDIAVVMVNGDEATIKNFYRESNGIKLIPTNPAYDIMFYTPYEVDNLPVTILGKVVELRGKF